MKHLHHTQAFTLHERRFIFEETAKNKPQPAPEAPKEEGKKQEFKDKDGAEKGMKERTEKADKKVEDAKKENEKGESGKKKEEKPKTKEQQEDAKTRETLQSVVNDIAKLQQEVEKSEAALKHVMDDVAETAKLSGGRPMDNGTQNIITQLEQSIRETQNVIAMKTEQKKVLEGRGGDRLKTLPNRTEITQNEIDTIVWYPDKGGVNASNEEGGEGTILRTSKAGNATYERIGKKGNTALSVPGGAPAKPDTPSPDAGEKAAKEKDAPPLAPEKPKDEKPAGPEAPENEDDRLLTRMEKQLQVFGGRVEGEVPAGIARGKLEDAMDFVLKTKDNKNTRDACDMVKKTVQQLENIAQQEQDPKRAARLQKMQREFDVRARQFLAQALRADEERGNPRPERDRNPKRKPGEAPLKENPVAAQEKRNKEFVQKNEPIVAEAKRQADAVDLSKITEKDRNRIMGRLMWNYGVSVHQENEKLIVTAPASEEEAGLNKLYGLIQSFMNLFEKNTGKKAFEVPKLAKPEAGKEMPKEQKKGEEIVTEAGGKKNEADATMNLQKGEGDALASIDFRWSNDHWEHKVKDGGWADTTKEPFDLGKPELNDPKDPNSGKKKKACEELNAVAKKLSELRVKPGEAKKKEDEKEPKKEDEKPLKNINDEGKNYLLSLKAEDRGDGVYRIASIRSSMWNRVLYVKFDAAQDKWLTGLGGRLAGAPNDDQYRDPETYAVSGMGVSDDFYCNKVIQNFAAINKSNGVKEAKKEAAPSPKKEEGKPEGAPDAKKGLLEQIPDGENLLAGKAYPFTLNGGKHTVQFSEARMKLDATQYKFVAVGAAFGADVDLNLLAISKKAGGVEIKAGRGFTSETDTKNEAQMQNILTSLLTKGFYNGKSKSGKELRIEKVA